MPQYGMNSGFYMQEALGLETASTCIQSSGILRVAPAGCKTFTSNWNLQGWFLLFELLSR
jgi:hypothetical protein